MLHSRHIGYNSLIYVLAPIVYICLLVFFNILETH